MTPSQKEYWELLQQLSSYQLPFIFAIASVIPDWLNSTKNLFSATRIKSDLVIPVDRDAECKVLDKSVVKRKGNECG